MIIQSSTSITNPSMLMRSFTDKDSLGTYFSFSYPFQRYCNSIGIWWDDDGYCNLDIEGTECPGRPYMRCLKPYATLEKREE
jgi:hypothetical protein